MWMVMVVVGLAIREPRAPAPAPAAGVERIPWSLRELAVGSICVDDVGRGADIDTVASLGLESEVMLVFVPLCRGLKVFKVVVVVLVVIAVVISSSSCRRDANAIASVLSNSTSWQRSVLRPKPRSNSASSFWRRAKAIDRRRPCRLCPKCGEEDRDRRAVHAPPSFVLAPDAKAQDAALAHPETVSVVPAVPLARSEEVFARQDAGRELALVDLGQERLGHLQRVFLDGRPVQSQWSIALM